MVDITASPAKPSGPNLSADKAYIERRYLTYPDILRERSRNWSSSVLQTAKSLRNMADSLPPLANPSSGKDFRETGFKGSPAWKDKGKLKDILKTLEMIWERRNDPLPRPDRRNRFTAAAEANIAGIRAQIKELERTGRGFTKSLLRRKNKPKKAKAPKKAPKKAKASKKKKPKAQKAKVVKQVTVRNPPAVFYSM